MHADYKGPLESYNSLTDENLAGYYSSPIRRRYLRRMGLITKDGLILDEETIRLYHAQKEHMQKSNCMIAEGLVKRAIENDRKRRGVLKKKMDELLKLETAEKIKYQARHPTGVATINPQATGPSMLSSTLKLYQEHLHLTSSQFDDITQLICEMKAANTIASQYVSPYTCTVRIRPPSIPRPVHSANAHMRQGRLKRPLTAPVGALGGPRPANDKIHTNVEMKLRFLGGNISLRGTVDPRHLVEVHQQHCGGNTITLYKGYLLVQDTFSFISRRHHQMPFGLSLYIDGLIDCRVSTCCEYKHQCGRRIGGKSAHFQLIGIDGGKPCYKCTVLSEQKAVPLQVTNKDPHATMQESSHNRDYQADFEDETGNETYGSDFESSQDPPDSTHKAGGKNSAFGTPATSSRSTSPVIKLRDKGDKSVSSSSSSRKSSISDNGGKPAPAKKSNDAIQVAKTVEVDAANNDNSAKGRKEKQVTVAVVTDERLDNPVTKDYHNEVEVGDVDDEAVRKYLDQVIANARKSLQAEAPLINVIPPSPGANNKFADEDINANRVPEVAELQKRTDSKSDSPRSDGGITTASSDDKESEVSLGLSVSDGTSSMSPTEIGDINRDGRSNRLGERSKGSMQENRSDYTNSQETLKSESQHQENHVTLTPVQSESPTTLEDDNRTITPTNP